MAILCTFSNKRDSYLSYLQKACLYRHDDALSDPEVDGAFAAHSSTTDLLNSFAKLRLLLMAKRERITFKSIK